MKAPPQNLPPAGLKSIRPAKPFNYSSAIKVFHLKNDGQLLLTSVGLLPLPADQAITGHVCQAARSLLDKSQAWLWQKAGVSRKTINDFENGFAQPKISLNLNLRRALEKEGAIFLVGETMVGVAVLNAPAPIIAEPSAADRPRKLTTTT